MSVRQLGYLGFLLLVFFFGKFNYPAVPAKTQDASFVTITKVIDGDTVEIAGGKKVRLIGIDTPETVDPRRPVGCFGRQASDFTKSGLLNQFVRLEKDVSETDKYGRLLRYVWLGDELFNETLVRQGYAHASSYPPDIKYQDRFTAAQAIARQAKLGLWGQECGGLP
jgi:micrococcal nuclease